ncbi:uncharacterized protein LOC131669773 isoform X2 [Phymastichus coffea]|uniref:uncharacterized protein LOC131669773 isoform X2 n=1 Tax=Phymastichus coffea TaxID=108790 RepID=UPI00273AF18B|nr:uncharacterized protein LOC131669773 isoform X2 [Phymastichus coffea]
MPKSEVNTAVSTSSYCFSWDDYQSHFSSVVRQLLDEECMLDVTLCAGGERIQAHRLVLCACSDLLADLCSQVSDDHITVILDDIDPKDVRSIVEFIYNGEVRTPVENINNFLAAAQTLKIQGLMEVMESEENEINVTDDCQEVQLFDEFSQDDDDDGMIELEKVTVENNEQDEMKIEIDKEENSDTMARRRRRSVCKKEYTDKMLTNAINDIKAGTSLLDAAAKFHIPRSTLYMRAKILGLTLNNHKCDYTADDMKAAIDAVIAGSSLQNAADSFGIPKTVLWRRIQKEGHVYRTETRRNYDAEKREAAVKALERGEALTKVAQEYQIPKTTLFRDKVRLVDEGRLPESDMKRRKSYIEGEKRLALEKAVAACKKGTMSQATASITYKIPKTTIWRRLQRDAAKTENIETTKLLFRKGHYQLKKKEDNKSENLPDSNFEVYCDEDSQIDLTYIEDSNMSNDPVIILTSDTAHELNLENNRLVVVQDDTEDNYITCGLELNENSSFDTKS